MTRKDDWTVSDEKHSTDPSYPEYKLLNQLDQASKLWKKRGWKADGLWSTKALKEVDELVEKEATKNPRILAFILASRRHNRRKRILLSLLAIFTAVTMFVAAWFINSENKRRLCTGANSKLAITWGQAEHKALEDAFGVAELSNSKNTHRRVHKLLDSYVADWSAVYTQACEATQTTGEQSNEILGLRLSCLNYRKLEFEALVDTLTKADVDVLRKAVEATSQLENLQLCTDTDDLLVSYNMMVQPKTALKAKRVEAIRYSLSTVKALETTGQYRSGFEIAEQLVKASDEIDYLPISAEAHYWAGIMLQQLAKYDMAAENYQKAYQYAAASNFDRMVAKALSQLVLVEGYFQVNHKEAKKWARLAQDAVQNPIVDEETVANYYNNLGMLHYSQGEYDRARTTIVQALEIRKKVFGSGHYSVAESLNGLANTYAKQGEYPKALRVLKKVLAIREKLFGIEHLSVAKTLHNIGETFYDSGNYQDAINPLQTAANIFRRTLGEKHPDLARIKSLIEAIQMGDKL